MLPFWPTWLRSRGCRKLRSVLAIDMLAKWGTPSGRDRVMGLWRPVAARSPALGVDALRPQLAAILQSAPANVQTAAAAAAGTMKIKEVGARLASLANDRGQADKTRAEALKALDQLEYPKRIESAQQALVMPGYRSRTEALRILAKVDPTAAPRRCATASNMVRPPSGKERWRFWPPCRAIRPATNFQSG